MSSCLAPVLIQNELYIAPNLVNPQLAINDSRAQPLSFSDAFAVLNEGRPERWLRHTQADRDLRLVPLE
jgi:hypothetical protein